MGQVRTMTCYFQKLALKIKGQVSAYGTYTENCRRVCKMPIHLIHFLHTHNTSAPHSAYTHFGD